MRIKPLSGVLGLLGLLFLGAGTPAAQVSPTAPVLSTIKSLSCTFPVSVAGSWDKTTGEAAVNIRKSAILTFKFDQIDVSESSARFVGPTAAPEHIVAQLSGANLHFMDIRPAGTLAITSVFQQVSRDQKLKAVYTRVDYLPISLPGYVTAPEVSQHYGECEVGS
jgi:hypothetical protein